MEKLELENVEGQFGLMLRDKDDHSNYVLIRLEDLESIISYYTDFKKGFEKWED